MTGLIKALQRAPVSEEKGDPWEVLEPYRVLPRGQVYLACWEDHLLQKAAVILRAQGYSPPTGNNSDQQELVRIIMSIPQEETPNVQDRQ